MSPMADRSGCPSGVAHGTMEVVQLLLVDAFTSAPFTGNPAGVCLTDADDAAWMQAVAAEVNVSETAFVDLSTLESTGEVGLRWFTPKVEVEICGHATLASAHVLFEQGLASSPIAFRTAAGVLRAEGLPGGGIELDFPVDEPVSALPDGHLADEFADALGAAVVELARGRYDVLVEIPSPEEVRDPSRTSRRSGRPAGAASSSPPVPRTTRRPARPTSSRASSPPPWASTRTGYRLGALLSRALLGYAPRSRPLVGAQLSPRGGEVGVELAGERVYLRGDAVTVSRGELLAEATNISLFSAPRGCAPMSLQVSTFIDRRSISRRRRPGAPADERHVVRGGARRRGRCRPCTSPGLGALAALADDLAQGSTTWLPPQNVRPPSTPMRSTNTTNSWYVRRRTWRVAPVLLSLVLGRHRRGRVRWYEQQVRAVLDGQEGDLGLPGVVADERGRPCRPPRTP